MKLKDGELTNPQLLRRVADRADHPAWFEFFATYDPLIRLWCRHYGLDDDTLEDLGQQIWIELADRLRSYHYDPGKTFRGWLRRFCHSRAIDLLRKRKTERDHYVADPLDDELWNAFESRADDEIDECDPQHLLLLDQAEQVQSQVKERVEPSTWDAFWRVAVESCMIRDVADEMRMSYVAVFAAHKRVSRMLRDEGQRIRGKC